MPAKWRGVIGACVLAAAPAPLGAWGSVGHRTIAFIAWNHLTPGARGGVRQFLEKGEYLDSIATWADSIVDFRPETAPWHYIELNVRRGTARYDEAAACPNHDCVVDQINRDLGLLRNPLGARGDKREALKFLVHFVGDIHQPLHCAGDNDRGGNEKWFRYYPRRDRRYFTWVSLHGFWDNLLEEKAHEDPMALAGELEREISPQDESDWDRGGPGDWAYESFRIARDEIYPGLPEGPILKSQRWGMDLPEEYQSGRLRTIVNRQLEKAGVRLAFLLNGIFEKSDPSGERTRQDSP